MAGGAPLEGSQARWLEWSPDVRLPAACGAKIPFTFNDAVIESGLERRFELMSAVGNIYFSLAKRCEAKNGERLPGAVAAGQRVSAITA